MINIYKNATILTMDANNTVLDDADLWVEDGKVIDICSHSTAPFDAHVHYLNGKYVTASLIDILAHVRIWRDIDEQINDANEDSGPYPPLMSAIDATDIKHFSFELARKGGVTTVQPGAGSANPIGGVWTILKTGGNYLEEMILVEK